MKDVQFFAPETLEEALQILEEEGPHISILAGGTDLVRDMNLEFKVPDKILWIGKLKMEYIFQENGTLHVGAATRMQTAADSPLMREKASAVATAAGKLASPPVRSLATLGGNLCTASPAADCGCALLGLGAEVVLTRKGGQRVVPLAEFYIGPNKTVIQPGEMLTEILIRPTGEREGSAYEKIGRRQAMTLAVVNAASRVKLDAHGKVEQVFIAVGAVAPTLLRVKKSEKMLLGQTLTPDAIREAAEAVTNEIQPIDDVHGTIWYRKKVTKVLVQRTLSAAAGL